MCRMCDSRYSRKLYDEEVEYRGKANDTIKDILSGIRSACTYVGANKLKDLSKCTTFVRVNSTHNTIFGNE